MREVWDVYTKDRRRTGKTCLRGEQGTLEEDEFHMWVMVWIKNARTGKYQVSQRSADKDTDPLKWEDDNETKWIVVPCDDEGIVLEDVEIPTDNEIYAQIAFQEQFFSGVLVK